MTTAVVQALNGLSASAPPGPSGGGPPGGGGPAAVLVVFLRRIRTVVRRINFVSG